LHRGTHYCTREHKHTEDMATVAGQPQAGPSSGASSASSTAQASAVSRSDSNPIRSDAPMTVVTRTTVATVAGVAAGAAYGVLKHQQPGQFALRQGVNAFAFAFPFFALREYAVGPAMAVITGTPFLDRTAAPSQIRSPRTHNLAASTVSGAIVGAGLATWVRGPKSLLPGMTTFGIICFGAQYLVNEAEILRIKLIAGYSGGGLQRLQEQARSETSTMADPRSILSSGGAAAAVPATSPSSAASEASSSSSWLSAMSPVRRVSDEEYAARLQAQQEAATARIAALKKEAAELEAQLADSSRAGTGTQ